VDSLKAQKKMGIPSGFRDIDKITGGWNKGELIIIAGRPGMGKSVIAKDFAENAGVPVLYFSLEMSKDELIKRQLSGIASVDFESIRTSEIHVDDWQHIVTAANKLAKFEIRYNDSGNISINEICAIAETEKITNGIGMVVIDYLQLIRSTEKTAVREQEVAGISRKLKGLARSLDIPVICLAQLNRKVDDRKPPIPVLSDLRESGSIEQDADIVGMVYRPWQYDKSEPQNKALFILAKSRNTRTGMIKLSFMGNFQRFENGGDFSDNTVPF
jgi:replicative DNA helicase